MGLNFAGATVAAKMMNALYDNGIWAVFSGRDASVPQFKPVLTVHEALCDAIPARASAPRRPTRAPSRR